MNNKSPQAEEPASDARSTLARTVKIAILIFGLILAGIAITAWVTEEDVTIPFQYDGFE